MLGTIVFSDFRSFHVYEYVYAKVAWKWNLSLNTSRFLNIFLMHICWSWFGAVLWESPLFDCGQAWVMYIIFTCDAMFTMWNCRFWFPDVYLLTVNIFLYSTITQFYNFKILSYYSDEHKFA